MIISHKHKFIFIKTRKTASTSLEILLSKFCGEEDVITPNIFKDEILRKQHGGRPPQNYYIPLKKYSNLDWLKLLYNRKRIRFFSHSHAQYIKKYTEDHIWQTYFKFCFERNPFDKIISRYYWKTREEENPPTLASFINMYNYTLSDFELYTINGKIAVDKVYHYEKMEEALADIQGRLQLKKNLDIDNIRAKGNLRKDRRHYKEVLSNDTVNQLKKIFAREIAHFNYTY